MKSSLIALLAFILEANGAIWVDICDQIGVDPDCCNPNPSESPTGFYWTMSSKSVRDNDFECRSDDPRNILVEINTQKENDCLVEYLSLRFGYTANLQFAIGLQDNEFEGVWEWGHESGYAKVANYQHWGPSYPKGGNAANCAVMNIGDVTSTTSPQGFWADIDCGAATFALCEQPRPRITTTHHDHE